MKAVTVSVWPKVILIVKLSEFGRICSLAERIKWMWLPVPITVCKHLSIWDIFYLKWPWLLRCTPTFVPVVRSSAVSDMLWCECLSLDLLGCREALGYEPGPHAAWSGECSSSPLINGEGLQGHGVWILVSLQMNTTCSVLNANVHHGQSENRRPQTMAKNHISDY